MAIMGNNGTPGAGDSPIQDIINAVHTATPASSGELVTIHAHIGFTWSGRNIKDILAKAAIYSVSGTTYTLIAETIERTFTQVLHGTDGFTWYTFTFASSQSVVGGTEYVLAVWSNNPTPTTGYGADLKFDTTSAFGITIEAEVYNGFKTPYTQTPGALDPSIYGTYTPDAVAGPRPGSLKLMGIGR